MRILMVDPSQAKLPVMENLIRADTYVSIPLAEGLIKRNHSVHFLTSKDSQLKVPQIKTDLDALFSVVPTETFYGIKEANESVEITKTFFANIFLKCREIANPKDFDIVHIHSNFFLNELELLKSIIDIPMVITLHSIPYFQKAFSLIAKEYDLSNKYFLSISNKQREYFPFFFYATTPNGIDEQYFQFDEKGGDVLLFSGRLRKIKGIKEAVLTAVKTNRQLQFTGKTNTENDFVEKEVKPLVQENPQLVKFLDYINRSNIPEFYCKGKLTLFPILWDEPFGLVQIESMSCGTPIVAYANGSVPEVINDGETGFIINPSDAEINGDWIIKKTGVEGLCEAVERIYSLPDEKYKEMRIACRRHVENYFTIDKMIQRYEEVYNKILEGNNK